MDRARKCSLIRPGVEASELSAENISGEGRYQLDSGRQTGGARTEFYAHSRSL